MVFLFIFASWSEVFALASPVEEKYWTKNTVSGSRSSFDLSRSTVELGKTAATLSKRSTEGNEGDFNSSGVLWTKKISFSKDIYSLFLSGVFYEPLNTNVRAFVSFESTNKEYPLQWNTVYQPAYPYRNLYLKIVLTTDDPAATPTLSQLSLKAEIQDLSVKTIARRDRDRVSNLKKIAGLLEKYHDDFGLYPIVNIEDSKKTQWSLLKNTLDAATLNYRKTYNFGFMDQITGVDENYQYGYQTGSSGVDYLLWINLEDPASESFKDSWTGEAFDINCQAPTYCLYAEKEQEAQPVLRDFSEDSSKNKKRVVQVQGTKFLRQENDSKVWLQVDNRRVWLRTPEIFTKAGGTWDKVEVEADLSAVPRLEFIKNQSDSAVYLISESGLKRAMPEQKIFDLYDRGSEIAVVDQSLIDSLPENHLIRAKGDEKVYYLDQKIKRWITTPEAFEKMGLNWDEVVEVDETEAAYYPEASPIF